MKKADCRVAVIGGGLSGLVIAVGLGKKGYRNVTVLEKDNRLGGKLFTIWYRGKSYELGAIFGLPVQQHLQALLKEFNIKSYGPNLTRVYYDRSGNKIMQIPKKVLSALLEEVERFPVILAQYSSLEKAKIEDLEQPLMMPFSQWCDYHRFRVLKKIYQHHFTSYGLGDIEQVPALYVLRILNYDTIMSLLDLPELFTWKAGVSTLIDALSQKIKNIRLGQKVTKIAGSNRQSLTVQTEFEQLEFERVVITAPLEQFSDLYEQDEEMINFLAGIKYQDYYVYAFIVDKLPKGCGVILEHLSNQNKGHIMIWNSRWESGHQDHLLTVYAYRHPDYSRFASLKVIENDLLRLGIANPRLYQLKCWKQSPYVDSAALQRGFYQKMEAMQGKHNVFLAGEIMSTVSMENCLRYANYLLNQFF